jgi:SAM-dependent methyltransferase
MGLIGLEDYRELLICPRCASRLSIESSGIRCSSSDCPYSRESFPRVSNLPALFDFENSIVSAEHLVQTQGAAQVGREPLTSALKQRLARFVHPRNYNAEGNVQHLLTLLRETDSVHSRPRILIIGGGALGNGVENLYALDEVDLLSFDIYASALVQFLADAHRIPLASQSVDAVLIQAVLEHVLEPGAVVDEIYRVLKPSGLVYAETPFLQQVHEGPYDFTRFTDSGHRYLFRWFERIDSGVAAGPGTQLAWSIDYFFRALFRSQKIGILARIAASWLFHLDRFLDPKYAIDGANGVYFLGRKATSPLPPHAMVSYYRGAQ